MSPITPRTDGCSSTACRASGSTDWPPPTAFYAYADVGHLTDDSYAWCLRMLDETGVAMAPGVDFDTALGHQFVRMSFAGATGEIATALERLAAWI